MPLTVAIVGRPNVGKSTLFNRLAGRRLAIVDDEPGVTRDRREGAARLGDLAFTIIDTAGFEDARADDLAARIQAQTERAVAEADVALFLIDARSGVLPLDRELASILRSTQRPVILVANKCEGRAAEGGRLEAFALGLGEPIPLSAEHGEGMAMLYEALQPLADAASPPGAESGAGAGGEAGAPSVDEPPLKLAIVGRPNVGKSTLINRLIGEERLITGPEAGITRDAIAVPQRYRGRCIELIDTAGLRRRARVDGRVEALAGAAGRRAICFAQVVVIVVDASLGLEKQDLQIAAMVAEEGRAPVLAANKWDRIEDRGAALRQIESRLAESLPQLKGLKPLRLSALTGEGVDHLLPAALGAYETWNRHVATGPLNRWLAGMLANHPPPRVAGRPLKIRYVTQVKSRPPTFALFVNRPDAMPEEYLRYLSNGLREAFHLAAVPLRLTLRRGRNPYAADR